MGILFVTVERSRGVITGVGGGTGKNYRLKADCTLDYLITREIEINV